ncbi:hypothetical protein DOTSEDRAFT_22561 [Dothistroma septosporum NZE10]|uniref:Uncharacterized protein n=1 Tax=Dothistroma septosporum (strain NZE10 / CBS 128990) TaxID=675120 RepID=N1PU81_DOTSN|nr:hypothetical protein DOTSEDRAFT_22561 [Dothistroma septosporum NZE10]
MSGFRKVIDSILTSKYNKPFPVTLLPSTIGYYLGLKQGERQTQLLQEIQALDIHDHEKVKRIAEHPSVATDPLPEYIMSHFPQIHIWNQDNDSTASNSQGFHSLHTV